MDKKLSISELSHIADLAKLELREEEKEKLLQDFEDMLFFAKKISNADVSIENQETFRLYYIDNLRQDSVSSSFSREKMISSAPTRTDSYITVPNIIEE